MQLNPENVVPIHEQPAGFIYTAIAAAREDRDREFELAFHTACQSVLRHVPPNSLDQTTDGTP